MEGSLNDQGYIKIQDPEIYEDCEWCFQFDEDEPVVFASTKDGEKTKDPSIDISIKNKSDSNVNFKYAGKSFRIFARKKQS